MRYDLTQPGFPAALFYVMTAFLLLSDRRLHCFYPIAFFFMICYILVTSQMAYQIHNSCEQIGHFATDTIAKDSVNVL